MFFAQTIPETPSQVLGLPLLCFIIGLALWYGGIHFENRTEKSWLKWLSVIPMLVILVMALPGVFQAMDYAYQQSMPNRRTLYSHYVAGALPLVGLGIIFAWHFYLKRSGSYEKF